MIEIKSEAELLNAFRIIDREEVEVSKDLCFPVQLQDYFAWSDSGGSRVYLVVNDPIHRLPFGIVFRKESGDAESPVMCEWCHSVRSGGGVKLLTATASSNRRVGINVCSDLSCKEKAFSVPNPNDVPQFVSSEIKVQRIIHRMLSFSKQNLF